MPLPEAAVAIVSSLAAEPSVLLIRRAERAADPWSGQWSFPGGHCDPQDATPLETALRELREECGLHLPPERLVKPLPHAVAGRRAGRRLLVAPFLFAIDCEAATRVDPQEAAEARWVPLRFLSDPARHRLQPVPGMPPEMLFPAVELGGPPLWGFTYRLLTEWLGLVPPPQDGDAAARRLLLFLTARGLPLASDWRHRQARVKGTIPVAAVVSHCSAPHGRIPPVNMVEVRPDLVRIIGLGLEEYAIHALP